MTCPECKSDRVLQNMLATALWRCYNCDLSFDPLHYEDLKKSKIVIEEVKKLDFPLE